MATLTAKQKRELKAIEQFKKEEKANAAADAKRNAAESAAAKKKRAAAAAAKAAAAKKTAAAAAAKTTKKSTGSKGLSAYVNRGKDVTKAVNRAVNGKAPSTRKNGKK